MTATAVRTLRTAIYARISEDRWDEQEGVEEQVAACEEYAASRGLEIVATFVDNNRSASKPDGKRPRYDELMKMVARGEIDVITTKYTARLYRVLRELIPLTDVLKRADVPVWAIKSGEVDLSTADGRLRANIMGSVSQHEVEVMGERVSAASERRAKKGRFNGGARRFGYEHCDTRAIYIHRGNDTEVIERPTGPLRLVRSEAAAIKWAYLHIQRGGSLESVVRMWRGPRHNLVGPTGAKFTASTVRDILVRPMNAGIVVFKGEILDAASDVPAIVDKATWHNVVAILSDPARRKGAGQPTLTLLAPVLRCQICIDHPERMKRSNSAKMTAKVRQRNNGVTEPIYGCRDGHVSRQRGMLDLAVQALFIEYVKTHAHKLRRPAAATEVMTTALAQADELRGRLAAYQAQAHEMEPADFRAATTTIRAKLAQLTERIVTSSGSPATTAWIAADNMEADWAGMNVKDRQSVLKENIDHIALAPGRKGVRGEVMAGVRIVGRDGTLIFG